jgi:hypothetical protein
MAAVAISAFNAFQVFAADAGFAPGEVVEACGRLFEAKVALQMGVDFDRAATMHQQGPRRRGAQQGGGRAGAGQDGIGTGDTARRHDQQQRGDRHPEGSEDDHHGRSAGSHLCVTPPNMRGHRAHKNKEKGRLPVWRRPLPIRLS